MKKLLLTLAFLTVGFASANVTNATIIANSSCVADEMAPPTTYTYVFHTSCGDFVTFSDKIFTNAELATAFVGIERDFCEESVSIDDVEVVR